MTWSDRAGNFPSGHEHVQGCSASCCHQDAGAPPAHRSLPQRRWGMEKRGRWGLMEGGWLGLCPGMEGGSWGSRLKPPKPPRRPLLCYSPLQVMMMPSSWVAPRLCHETWCLSSEYLPRARRWEPGRLGSPSVPHTGHTGGSDRPPLAVAAGLGRCLEVPELTWMWPASGEGWRWSVLGPGRISWNRFKTSPSLFVRTPSKRPGPAAFSGSSLRKLEKP